MSDDFSPSANFSQAHVVGGVASDDINNHLLLRLDPTTKRLLVAATTPHTGVTDGEAVDAADTGMLILGTDGSNYQVLATDTSGNLQVDIVSSADLTTIIGHVDGIEASVDGIEGLLTTIDSDTSAMNTNLATLAGAVSGTEVQVDVLTMPSVTVDSEFPDAAALGDNTANPTTTVVGSFMHGYDGSTWDRIKTVAIGDGGGAGILAIGNYVYNGTTWDRVREGGEAGSILVDLGANNDVTVSGVATAANQTTIIGHVDGIEASIDGIEGLLTTIDADTGNISLAVAAEGAALGSGILMQGDDGTDRTNVLVDTDGHLQVDVLSGGGGGTQYNIDTALGATDTTTLAGVVRDDSLSTLTEADGDVTVLRVSSTGALHVTGGGGGTEYTEDVATANPIVGTATLIERDDALSTVTPIEGDWIGLRGTAEGALWVQDFNSDAILADTTTIIGHVDGIEASVDGIEGLLTTIDADTSSMNTDLGTIAGAIKGEDAVHGSGDSGIMSLAVRNDTLAALAGADGDYAPLQVNASGALFIQEGAALDVSAATVTITGTVTANLSATDNAVLDSIDADLTTIIGHVDGIEGSVDGIEALLTTIDADTSIMSGWDNAASDGASVSGDVAHDGVDAGEPVKIGGRAQAPTAALEEVADNDRVDAAMDRQGRLAVWNGYPVKSADINDSTSGNNTIVAAAGAGLRIAVIGCVIISDGTTDVRWEDGAGGTAFTGQMPLQAREGFVMPIGFSPWFVGTANTLLNLELTAAVNVHGIVTYVEMTD